MTKCLNETILLFEAIANRRLLKTWNTTSLRFEHISERVAEMGVFKMPKWVVAIAVVAAMVAAAGSGAFDLTTVKGNQGNAISPEQSCTTRCTPYKVDHYDDYCELDLTRCGGSGPYPCLTRFRQAWKVRTCQKYCDGYPVGDPYPDWQPGVEVPAGCCSPCVMGNQPLTSLDPGHRRSFMPSPTLCTGSKSGGEQHAEP